MFRSVKVIVVVVVLGLFFGLHHAQAQSAEWQTITNSDGYQFQVPADWIAKDVRGDGTSWTVTSPTHGVVVINNDILSGFVESPQSWLQGVSKVAGARDSSYRISLADSGPTSLPGADSAYEIVSSHTDALRTSWNGFHEATAKGGGIYTLTVEETADFTAQNPGVAEAILQSFQPTNWFVGPLAQTGNLSGAPGTSGLLRASGTGNQQTDTFDVNASRIQLCWSIGGKSPGGSLGPDVTFYVYPLGSAGYVGSFDEEQAGQGCSFVYLSPGTYYVKTIATPWTGWDVTVTSA